MLHYKKISFTLYYSNVCMCVCLPLFHIILDTGCSVWYNPVLLSICEEEQWRLDYMINNKKSCTHNNDDDVKKVCVF